MHHASATCSWKHWCCSTTPPSQEVFERKRAVESVRASSLKTNVPIIFFEMSLVVISGSVHLALLQHASTEEDRERESTGSHAELHVSLWF